MLVFIHQHQFLFRKITGTIFIPVTLCLWFIHHDLFTDNFTGLLNDASLFPFLHIYCFSLLVWMDHILIRKRNIFTWGFEICAVLAAVIPYRMDSSLLQSMHLLFSYGAFLLFQQIILTRIINQPELLSLYLGTCILCFLLTITFSSIVGFTELLYAITISILIVQKNMVSQ